MGITRHLVYICSVFGLASCSSNPVWKLQQLEGSRSAQLMHRSPDPAHGIDIEFLRTGDTVQAFLHVHSHPLPVEKENPKYIAVLFQSGTNTQKFYLYRHNGGQTLAFTDEARQFLMDALSEPYPLSISLSKYCETIPSSKFPSFYNRLTHPFPITNPFRLHF